MDYQAIIAGTVGRENTYGTIMRPRARESRSPICASPPMTSAGKMRAYVGEGEFTNDPLETFGGYGVVQVPHLQELLRYICENGFEHHVAINQTRVSGPLPRLSPTILAGRCTTITSRCVEFQERLRS